MSATDFEYAIKKDVRNNPIVREIDEARQRQFVRAVGIGALLVAVLLFSAWQHFELVQHGYLMERLQRELAVETEANRQLKLLIATLRAPQRIETVATGKLHMVEPGPADVVIIERVATPAPPAKSIVAAR